MKKKKLASKSAWYYQDESGGWVTRYEQLDQLTVKGSGHFVPGDRPREALQMIANFIWNKPYGYATGISIVPAPMLQESTTTTTSSDSTTTSTATIYTSATVLLLLPTAISLLLLQVHLQLY